MINIMWFVIVSSHAVVNSAKTSLCGRAVRGEVTEERPNGVRSCETCLRSVTRLLGE